MVLGGANTQGWSVGRQGPGEEVHEAALLARYAAEVVAGGGGRRGGNSGDSGDGSSEGSGARAAVLLLQREVPERVNEAFAAAAAAAGIPVMLDAGGCGLLVLECGWVGANAVVSALPGSPAVVSVRARVLPPTLFAGGWTVGVGVWVGWG